MKKILFLLLTAVCAMLYAPPAQAWTAYLQMSSTPSETPKIWAWNDDSGKDVGGNSWDNRPSMTELDGNKYSFTGTGSPTNIKFTIGSTESKNLTFTDGEIYSWNGTSGNGGLAEREESVTIYIKDSSVKSDDIYLYVYGGSNYKPEELNKFNSDDMADKKKAQIRQYQKVETDIYKITFSLKYTPGNAHIMVTDGKNNWKSDEPVLYNGHQYTLSSTPKLNDDGVFVPSVTVTSVELLKDGEQYTGSPDSSSPYQFTLSNLTGTGLYQLKVNYSNGDSRYYIRADHDSPLEASTTGSTAYNLVEGNSTNSFRLNSTNSQHIISNATMTVNFSGTDAVSYTLSDVTQLSNTAKAYLYDGTDRYEMEHRRDGKFVLQGFTPDAAKRYTIVVSINDNGAMKETHYTVKIPANPLEGGVRDAKESTDISADGFTFDTAKLPGSVNVSARLDRGKVTKISAADIDSFWTIYFKRPDSEWKPYARLSSNDNYGFWWTSMKHVEGTEDIYSVTFDPNLYQMVRFLRQDNFDRTMTHQTARVKAINGHLYTIGNQTTDGYSLTSEAYTPPVVLQSVSLVYADDLSNAAASLALDGSGNWKATLPATLTGSFLIKTVTTGGEGAGATKYYTINAGGTLSAAPAGGVAAPVTIGENGFSLDFNGGSSAIISLVMSNDGSTPTGAFLTDPDKVISDLRLVSRFKDGLSEYDTESRFTTADGGKTWIWHGKVKKGDDYKYYIKGINANGTVHEHSIGSDEKYWINKNTDYTNWTEKASWNGNTYSFCFNGYDSSIDKGVKITITTKDGDQTVLNKLSYTDEAYTSPTETAPNIHMPLTAADFVNADGSARPHYFIVGVRTADWRLQPEWELHVNDAGTEATLSGRLMYQQWFGIAKVDNYNNYVNQKYTLYGCSTTPEIGKNDSGTTYTLSYKAASSATDYSNYTTDSGGAGKQGTHEVKGMFKWMGEISTWDNKWSGWSWTRTNPSLLEKVTLTLKTDKTPDKIKFEFTQDAAKVGAARTFSITGENIKYHGDYTFSDGIARNLAKMTPGSKLGRKDKDKTDRWGNAWVQSDADGRPYVDGNGDLVYNTAFDKEWLSKHHVNFYNAAKDVEYTSYNTVFMPADPNDQEDEFTDLYKMHPASNGQGYNKIGGDQRCDNIAGYNYTELFDADFKDGRNEIENSKWQCYVVKDMWIEGQFKIWTGWGGNMKLLNDVDDGDVETAEQWFYENAGHQEKNKAKDVEGYDVTVSGAKVTVYPTRRDVEQANFNVKDMTYFSRVILWYNPDDSDNGGCSNSVLQFVRAQFGPNIQAFHNLDKRNTLRYEWWIDSQDSSNDLVNITGYEIRRYKLVGDALTEETVVEATPGNSSNYHNVGHFHDSNGNAINKIEFKDDSKALSGGQYLYKIKVTFSNGQEKNATSNVVKINAVSVPVKIEAQQVKTQEGKYTFDLDLTIKPNTDLSAKVGDGETTVKDMMRYYVLTVGAPTAKRLNDETTDVWVDGSPMASKFRFKQAEADEILIADGTYLPAGTWYYRKEITDADKLAEKFSYEIDWKCTPPNTDQKGGALYTWKTGNDGKRSLEPVDRDHVAGYLFRCYLVSEDSDIDQWKLLNFSVSESDCNMIAPDPGLTLNSVVIRKAIGSDGKNLRYDPSATDTHKDHLSGTRLVKFYENDDTENGVTRGDRVPGEYEIRNHIVYNLNEVVADVTVDALPVDETVTTDNGAYYDLYIVKSESEDGEHADVTDLTDFDNKANNARLDVTAATAGKGANLQLYDIDLSGMTKAASIDGSHNEMIDATQTHDFDSHILVTYRIPKHVAGSDGQTAVEYDEYVNVTDNANFYEFNHGITAPELLVTKKTYSKYEGKYYHNGGKNHLHDDYGPQTPCGCGTCNDDTEPWTETLGYYANGVVDFAISKVNGDEKNAYIEFHAQQQVCTYSGHDGGCYPYNDNWYKHSFSGSRAANGGVPYTGWSTIDPLTDGTVTYTETVGEDGWSDANDWSALAVKSGRLPLQINPAFKFAETDDDKGKDNYDRNIVNNTTPVTAWFSAVYPIVKNDKLTVVNATPESSQQSPAIKRAAAPARIPGGVYLMAASSSTPVGDWKANEQTTGVDEIVSDADNNDAPVEYYNLQGFRVMNPAKGQIYIVRQGNKVSKVLYR